MITSGFTTTPAAQRYNNNAVVMGYGNGTTVSLVGFGAYNNPHVTANAAPPAGTHDDAQNAARPYVVFNGTWTYF